MSPPNRSTLRTLSELQQTGGELSVAVKTLKAYMQVSHDANIVVLEADALKQLVNTYAQIGKQRKPLDVPLDSEAYSAMTDVELDEKEAHDDMFLRSNATHRSNRYIKNLSEMGGYWGWKKGGVGEEKARKDEEEWMEGLKKKEKAGGGGGIGGMFGKPKKNCLLSMFG